VVIDAEISYAGMITTLNLCVSLWLEEL